MNRLIIPNPNELNELVPLAEGYERMTRWGIEPDGVADLSRQVHGDRDKDVDWEQCIEQSLVAIGVYKDEKLVTFARLAGDRRSAILDDLLVDSEVKTHKIGSVCIDSLITIADLNEIYKITAPKDFIQDLSKERFKEFSQSQDLLRVRPRGWAFLNPLLSR